jgi:hypothetical protein
VKKRFGMRRRNFGNGCTKRRSHFAYRPRGLLFPPRAVAGEKGWRHKGRQRVTYLTVNGRVEIDRVVYWRSGVGTRVPADEFLGIASSRYSPGVRELACREAMGGSFRQGAEDLARVGQIVLSEEMMRRVVEAEGRRVLAAQKDRALEPGWTAEGCREKPEAATCVISGADGVKVPMVTEAEKQKRRSNGRAGGKASSSKRKRGRKRKGSDQAYKEFKIVAFYDPSHEHQYAVGTSGDHRVLGRLMRREAGRLGLDRAGVSYSVSDGAEWIRKQYQSQLPMLSANVLDYYHLREHLIRAAKRVFGEGSPAGQAWRKRMSGCVIEKGPVELLGELRALRQSLRSPTKRKALTELENYIAARIEMLQYPEFLARKYEIGSGPTESFCKTLTARLKGSGMRWDKPNAEALMALAAVRQSHLWTAYWKLQQAVAA